MNKLTTGFWPLTILYLFIFNTTYADLTSDNSVVTTSNNNIQEVERLQLIDAENDTLLYDIDFSLDTVEINLNSLPTVGLNINAIKRGANAGSMGFELFNIDQGTTYTRKENVAPYALFGDSNGDYNNWSPRPKAGDLYMLKVSPFSQSNLGGEQGVQLSVILSFVEEIIPSNEPPIVNVYSDVTITLPRDEFSIYGFTRDNDGYVVDSVWTKEKGSDILTEVERGRFVIYPKIAGEYIFRLTATDNKGAVSYDEATIVVKNPEKLDPIVSTLNRRIEPTQDTVILTAFGNDPDGGEVSYLWELLDGPNAPIMEGAQTNQLLLDDLQVGEYNFQITVTDDEGAVSSAKAKVTVKEPEKFDPVVTTFNRNIQSTQDTVILIAFGSDPDGGDVSYKWEFIDGPNEPTMEGAQSKELVLSNFQVGDYSFQVTITDDEGMTATSITSLNVFLVDLVCEGNVTLTTQAEVKACKCTEITGLLKIQGEDITDLSALKYLKKIGNGLTISGTNISELESFTGLEEFGGGLGIFNNQSLKSLQGLRNINKETFIKNLSVRSNQSLINLDGLEFIKGIFMIFIEENEMLENIDGLINLTSLQHNTNINNNPNLKNIDGLQNAVHTGTASVPSLNIYRNSSLNVCCGALSFMSSPEVSPSISNNAPGCNSKNEISSSCNSEPISLKFEAEDHYSVLTDVGNYDIGVNLNGSMSNQYAVTMYDKGDQVNISFDVPERGEYIIKVNLRSGHRFNATAYWPSGYQFQLNGENIILEGDASSVSPFQTNHGGSYFGNMESEKVFLTAGEHNLTITTNSKWSLVDFIEIIGEEQETVNQSPTQINLSSLTAYTIFTGPVANIFVEDPNTNDTHTLELIYSNETQHSGFFRIERDSLILNQEYYRPTTLSIRIRATDSKGNQKDQDFLIDVQENPTFCSGNITLSSQEEVDNFNCSYITRSLIISGDDITDLTPLKSLDRILLHLVIKDNPLLENLKGLENLQFCFNVVIDNNASLKSTEGFEPNHIDGNIYIRNNPQLVNISNIDFPIYSDALTLELYGNKSLETCCIAERFIGSNLTVYDNAPGCNTKGEIEVTCNEQPIVTTRFEAEAHFSVLTDIGSYKVGANFNGFMSRSEAVIMYDNGDKIRLDFSVPVSGNYKLAVNLRSGHRFNPVAYWPAGYEFNLNGTMLTMQGNNESISNLLPTYGGTYFGNMESTVFLTEGNHYLEIEANASWAIVDYLEVTSLSSSARLANLNQPEKEEDMLNIDRLTVYPNPTSGLLNISLNGNKNLPTEIKLLDSTGRILEKRRYEGNIHDTINLSGYAKGYYIITLQSGGEVHHKKIILN